MNKIAGFIYDHSRIIIALVIVLNLLSLASFFRFSLDANFLTFISRGNPKAEEYHNLIDRYQTGETISILIEKDGSLLEKDSLLEIYELQQQVLDTEGITGVQGFIPASIVTATGAATADRAYLDANYPAVVDFIENRYFLTDQFLAEDRNSAILVATLDIDADAGDTIDSLETIARTSPLELALTGNEIIKNTIWDYLLLILFVLPPCAIVLVLAVFYVALRNVRLTLLSMVPAGLAALWTFGTIFWSGQDLNLLTVLSPLFILVMGSAYGLHYTSHLLDNMSEYPDRRELTKATLRMVGKPIFLATITTMAGFISLVWTEIVPMRAMGIFVTLGIGYAGIIALFFLPAVLSRMKLPNTVRRTADSRLNGFILKASQYRVLVPVAFAIIVIVSVVFIPSLQVESNTLTYFKESSEIRQAFSRVEENFGSAIPLTGEIKSSRGLSDLADVSFANKVLATERQMEGLPGIRSVFSAFDLLVGYNSMLTGEAIYPANPASLLPLLSGSSSADIGTWVSSQGFKMVIKTEELDAGDIDILNEFVAEHNDTVSTVSGLPVLYTEMNRLVIQGQVQSLGLAMVLIFIMLWLTLRRVSAAFAGLLPIIITICAILGMLSMTGFNINLMTANLSAIAIGVGVDYSIHLISGVYYLRARGMARRESVDAALSTVSRPVLANAFGLAIGLSALFFSPLRIHTQAASVMWVAMVVSSLAALLLVPQFYAGRKRQ